MKGTVVYDTHYGNTRIVAEAIAGELESEGYEAELRNVGKRYPEPPTGDILFLGSPVRFGSVSGGIKKFAKALDTGYWQNKPVVVFTTILALPGNPTPKQKEAQDRCDISAGLKLVELLKSRGLNAVENQLWVGVTGLKGPLVATGVEETGQFTRNMLTSLKA